MSQRTANKEFDPSVAPLAYLLWHVTQKGLQVGALAGLIVGVPFAAFRHRRAHGSIDAATFHPRALKTLVNTTGITALVSALAGLGVVSKEGFNKEKLEDRVYRLHYNEGQNRTDEFAKAGAVLGAASAALMRGPSTINIAAGGAAGMAAGVVLHAATYKNASAQSGKESVAKVVEELKR